MTPGITALEYHKRRSKLAASLPNNSIAILAASDTKYRSGAVFYEFHQDSNFFYLTGFNEPEATAVIQKVGQPGSGDYIFHLFVRPKDVKAESWDGARSGNQAALDVFNADQTGDISNLSTLLPPILAGASEVFTDLSDTRSSFSKFFTGDDASQYSFRRILQDSKVKPLKPILNELRVFKSDAEVALMLSAGRISGRALTNAMRTRWKTEKELDAFLEYHFKIGGCDTAAYIPVIAGGKHALKIHYVRNDDILHDGDMVLVDAGGEVGGYITDITRTWPVSGKFSDAQKDLYNTILDVQRSSISLCRQSAGMSLDEIHKITEQGLLEGLKQLGFDMSGNAIDILFPHHVGHYIGLDVHDCPGYPRTGSLRAGQCVTVEPGIYVPNEDRWPKHFKGLGIRIEDSICVQDDSNLVLTAEAAKEVDDIEALRN